MAGSSTMKNVPEAWQVVITDLGILEVCGDKHSGYNHIFGDKYGKKKMGTRN